MVNWQSLPELENDAAVFTKFMHALLGLYAWEFFCSLDFEWDFISGKKKFRWPLIFYFAGRYCLLFAMIGIAIALDTTTEINCEALYTFNQLFGDAAVGLASINLSLRTMAVWSQNKYIIGLLVLLVLGHWSLILQGVLLKAQWVTGQGCVITHTGTTVLAATFVYSMAFDLIVLLLSAYKLSSVRAGGSKIGAMIFGDGLIFFIIAFLSNLIATVFMVLNLNSIMSIIFNVPAAVASTIVASRAVRRLTNFTSTGPDVYISTAHTSGSNAGTHVSASVLRIKPNGVHVQMETFTHAEDRSMRRYTRDGLTRDGLTVDAEHGITEEEKDSASDVVDFKRVSYLSE